MHGKQQRVTRTCERAAGRYRRDQGLIDRLLILSVVLLIVIGALAALADNGNASTAAVFIFGAACGFSVMLILFLGIGISELRRRGKARRIHDRRQ